MNVQVENFTNFVIVSIPRSGSNYLCGMLNSHPEILCHHELYHGNDIYYALDHRGDMNLGDVTYRNENPLRFLSSVWETRFASRAVGFKIFPGHNDQLLKTLLQDPTLKKIFLERPNLLRVFVSKIVAEETGIYSSLQGAAQLPNNVHISITEFKAFVSQVNNYFASCRQVLAETGQSHITIRYPEILEGREMARLLEYLRVAKGVKLSTPHQKQGKYHLRQMISNYDEVAECLASDNLSHYLEESCE